MQNSFCVAMIVLYRPRQSGTALYSTEVAEVKVSTKHLRKTYIYKQQAKHYLLLTSPAHVQYSCQPETPVLDL